MKNISRMEKFLQKNSLKESMLLVKAKILQACHLHSNFSLTLSSERLMLTVRRKKRLKASQFFLTFALWDEWFGKKFEHILIHNPSRYQFHDFWKNTFCRSIKHTFCHIRIFFFFMKKNQLRLTKSSIFSAIYLAPHLTIEYCCIFHIDWFFRYFWIDCS